MRGNETNSSLTGQT